MIQEKVAQATASGESPMLLSLRNVGKVFSNGVTALSKVDLTI
ncbi:MAG: ABC transporter ATP-binding protein, partial [Mesorhizobium sp.]